MEPGEEYEQLPTSSVTTHLTAGAMAGIMEHCTVYPMDSIKTKMQSLNPSTQGIYRTVTSTFRAVAQSSGVLSTFRGVNAVAMGAGPAHALYFAAYEGSKTVMGAATGHNDTSPLVSGTAGMAATVIHDAFMNPFDVIKQRLQMHNSPFTGIRQCVRTLLETEGPRAFYRSFTTQLAMNIPFQSIQFSSYEIFRHQLNPSGRYDPLTHVLAGGAAGGLAAAVTTPLDVCKTVLNTQEQRVVAGVAGYTNGIFDAASTVYRLQGATGFLRGIRPRVLYHVPSTAISWSVYEFFKHMLTMRQQADETVSARPLGVGVMA